MTIVDQLMKGVGSTAKDDGATDVVAKFAKAEDIDVNLLKAVTRVESPEGAFDDEGRLPFLPEAHKLWKHLRAQPEEQAKAVRHGLARRYWSPDKQYKGLGGTGSAARWERLRDMAEIDEAAALKSCSWGAYQLMGEHFGLCGYGSPQEFVTAMASSRAAQDEAFLAFIRKAGLLDELKSSDIRGFVRGYNGSGQVDAYTAKIAEAYRELTGEKLREVSDTARAGALRLGSKGARVRALQERLAELGFMVRADGDFGPKTKRQVRSFQAEAGITTDGIAGPATMAALESHSAPADHEREKLNPKDLDGKSRTVEEAKKVGLWGKIKLAAGGLFGSGVGAGEMGWLDSVESAAGTGKQAVSAFKSVKGLLEPLASPLGLVLIGLLVLAGVYLIWREKRIKDVRTDDQRTEAHV